MARVSSEKPKCRTCGEKPVKTNQNIYCSVACSIPGRAEKQRTAEWRNCEHCGAPFRIHLSTLKIPGKGRFCSGPCHYAHDRKYPKPEPRPCAYCSTLFTPPADQLAKGDGLYCSTKCGNLGRRTRPDVLVCVDCGRERPNKSRVAGDKNPRCGPCQAKRNRKRVPRVCQLPTCREPFEVIAAVAAKGGGHFHSQNCYFTYRSQRWQQQRDSIHCARCSIEFQVAPALAARRKYCSWACFLGPSGGAKELPCEECGTPHKVYQRQLDAGRGRFCSRKCRSSFAKKNRPTFRCPRCKRAPQMFPSRLKGRRWHNWECRKLARKSKKITCAGQGCTERFERYPWETKRFHNEDCAYRNRRARTRSPDVLARNHRILELHALGLTAAQIGERLASENPDWWASKNLVRWVVHSERQATSQLARR